MTQRIIEAITPYSGMLDRFDVLCVDTEFSDLPYPKESMSAWQRRVEILSVGICAVDSAIAPATFYAVRELNKKIFGKCSPFVKENVIPFLDACDVSIRFQMMSDLREQVSALVARRAQASGKGIAVASDWQGDLLLLSELFPSTTTYVTLEDIFYIQNVMSAPLDNGLVRHNALHDCMALRAGLLGAQVV